MKWLDRTLVSFGVYFDLCKKISIASETYVRKVSLLGEIFTNAFVYNLIRHGKEDQCPRHVGDVGKIISNVNECINTFMEVSYEELI